MRLLFADCLDRHKNRIPRLLISVLIAVALLATPIPYAVAPGSNLLHHSAKHLPSKHLVKTRSILASSTRSSPINGSESKPQTAKQLSPFSARNFRTAESTVFGGLPLVFRPLRC